MAPTAHSKFSASSAARLLACPGSFELGIRLDDGKRRSSVFSAEGTLAHSIAEVSLSTGKDAADYVGQKRSADGFEFTISDEFAEHAQVYVDFVRVLRSLGYVVALEQQVDPSVQWSGHSGFPDLAVDLFGTGDCVAYHPDSKHLVIGDLKFGAGVPVDVEKNAQLMYYGAGSAHEKVLRPICDAFGVPFNGVDTVTLTIIQPRAFHRDGPVRRYDLDIAELQDWARTVLYPGVQLALADKGQTTNAGTWCRWCPVLAHCEKPRQLTEATARAAFLGAPIQNIPAPSDQGAALPAAQLTDDVLSDLLDKITIIEPWLKAIKELGHERLENGTALSGWKLVPKRALRKWAADETELIAALGQHVSEDLIVVTKLKTPAQVERAVGKQAYTAHVAPHVVKSSSGTTLAVEGDPRARIEARRSPQQAFRAPTTTTNPKP